MRTLNFLIVIVLSGQLSFGQQSDQADINPNCTFRASVVQIDITPDNPQHLVGYGARISTGVHDRIYHRILALDDGTTQFFLVSTEVCSFSPVEYDRIAEQVNDKLGIRPENLWWTTTHTHSAPELGPRGLPRIFMGERYKHEVDAEYTAFVEQTLINGIREAREKLSPARLGVNWGFSQANINRRAIDVDGKASLGLNPDGPVDRRIGLLRIDAADGTPMVLVANYPIHGTVLGSKNLEISGDAPGIVCDYVEEMTGAPLLFINGALGNMAPIYSVYPDPQSGHLGQFRVLLGDKILDANRKITSTTARVVLSPGSLIVETPRKPDLGWPSDFGNYTRTSNTGVGFGTTSRPFP